MTDPSNSHQAYEAAAAPPPSNGAPGGALATVGPAAALPMPYGGMQPLQQDVIRGGMDPNSLFHSFRRRWLLAICMGLVIGALGGAGLYFLFPESSSATQYFKVEAQQQSVLKSGIGVETDFDIFRNTQLQMIRNPYVIRRALSDLGSGPFEFFRGVEEEKQVQHLADEIRATYPNDAEVLQVTLSGSATEAELKRIVEAVSNAYEVEVVFNVRSERLKPRQILRDSHNKLLAEIQRKTEKLREILRDQGGARLDSGERDPESVLLMSEISDLQRRSADIRERLITLSLDFETNKRLILDPQLKEERMEEAISAMPDIQQMESEMVTLKSYMRQLGGQTNSQRPNPQMAQLQQQYQTVAQELAATRKQLLQQMKQRDRTEPDPELRHLTRRYQQERAVLGQQLKGSQARIAEVTEILRERGNTSVDAMMRENEIEGLERVAESIALRIREWDVESRADNRIERVGDVETNKGINTLQRYAIAGVGGLACFALTCFGISYMEFRNRRLNGPEQVDEGLGIRVIGTLPALGGRKALNPRHPVVAQLTESVDSVRTALMHEATSKRRQIVMVTSAAAMEGRTTVASQLAASLARAGRRTLLIDGDLRRPALHNLFDVPLEDGLCEVLRAETDVTDVVRPTHAEGLWLITAGYCDADAVHALATDQVQPIFEKLRADYDFIIIDAAPVLGLSDSLLFGQHCDGAILSVLRDHTSVPKIHQSAELLKSVGIRLMGAVVNGVVTKADRRVTHLQAVTPKSEQKQLEQV